MPATEVASSRAAQSLARREAKICRCPASWARKLSWVQRMPRAAAIRSWNQLSPIRRTRTRWRSSAGKTENTVR